ncbi:MAG: hypothetical protein NT077_01445 [Candidatus Taylorbacteria bacterium]|nr:hypothetical protein [Candidatus Taylorbacteria bacterium]
MTPTTTITLSAFIDSSPFWSSFFAQLFATLIVVIIGSFLAPPIIRWRQRAKMKFRIVNYRKSKAHNFVTGEADLSEYILYLSVKNSGKKTVERFYWEMYIDKNYTSELVPKPPYPNHYTMHKEVGKKFTRYYGYVEMPIFPLDAIDFVFEVRFTRPEKEIVSNIYYCFRNDFGDSPAWSWIAQSYGKIHWLRSLTIN